MRRTSLYSRDELVENKSRYVAIVPQGAVQRYALARAPATNRVFVLWGWAGVFEGGVGFRGPRSEAECAQERSDQLDLRLLPTKSSAWLCPLVVFPM